MTNFPFQDFEELDFGEEAKPFIKTAVNSIPLDCSPYVAPYVPSTDLISRQAVAFANISNHDKLIDLGCGNGILFKHADCPSIGVELDVELYKYCIKHYPHVEMFNCDMFTVDLINLRVTVSILYLLPAGLKRLREMLSKWLEWDRSFRLVTIFYQIEGWRPAKTLVCDKGEEGYSWIDFRFMGGSDNENIVLYDYDHSSF